MIRSLGPIVVALTMLASTSALAQDEAGGNTGGVTSGNTETTSPNAPVQSAPDESPLPPGDTAGNATAAGWAVGPTTIAVGAAVAGGAVCLAVCSGRGSNTTTTTTTSPK